MKGNEASKKRTTLGIPTWSTTIVRIELEHYWYDRFFALTGVSWFKASQYYTGSILLLLPLNEKKIFYTKIMSDFHYSNFLKIISKKEEMCFPCFFSKTTELKGVATFDLFDLLGESGHKTRSRKKYFETLTG